jgi:O-antigen/teichoic acid export membrane protein
MLMRPSIRTYGEMFVARALAMLGPFVVAVITARMLGPEDRGRYFYILTLATVGAQLASCGIYASNSYLVVKDRDLLPRLLSNSVWIALVGGILAAVGVIGFDFAMGEARHREALIAAVLALSPLMLLFLYLSNLLVAIGESKAFNKLVVVNSALWAVTGILAAVLVPTLNAFLAATVVTGALTSALAWILAARGRPVPRTFDWTLFSRSIAFAARAHVAALLGFLMARTAVVVLRYDGTFDEIGQWSIAAQIADALLLLPATVGLLLFPALVGAEEGDRWSEFTSMLVRVGAIMAAICLVVAAIAGPAIKIVFGADYQPAADIMLALLPGIFFLSITTVASQFLSAFGIPLLQLAAWLVSWIMQVALSLAVLRPYGALGLAWVQSGCAGLVCVWLLVLACGYSPRRRHLLRH